MSERVVEFLRFVSIYLCCKDGKFVPNTTASTNPICFAIVLRSCSTVAMDVLKPFGF